MPYSTARAAERTSKTRARGTTHVQPAAMPVAAQEEAYGQWAMTSRLSAEDLLAFARRWSESNRPLVVDQAIAKLLLFSAHYQTHDPALMHILTGFPLRFSTLAVSTLLRSDLWLGPYGYASLIEILACEGIGSREIDAEVSELILQLFGHSEDRAALATEWDRCMGVKFEI